jgi:polysaccharide biosynthesis transport protein
MELNYFLSVLSRRKWLLLAVMLLTAATTYFVANSLPKKYKSSAVITTGIMDFKGIRVGEVNPFVQEFEIEGKFSNLTEYMKSRPSINILTKQLMLHDLLPDSTSAPFNKLDTAKLNIPTDAIQNYLGALKLNPDSIGIKEEDFANIATARALEKALGYDYDALFSKIDIKRVGKTDYVSIEYTSEDPRLSYFVTKKFTDEFLNFYYTKRDSVGSQSVEFYNDLTSEKKRILDTLNSKLNSYSKNQQVVAIEPQAQSIVSQLKELEGVRDEEKKKLASYEQEFTVYNEDYKGVQDVYEKSHSGNLKNRSELTQVDEEIKALIVKAKFNNNSNPSNNKAYSKKLAELENKRNSLSGEITDYITNTKDPRITRREDIYLKKKEYESKSKASSAALISLENRINELRRKLSKLVTNVAEINHYDQQIEIAKKEYESAVAGKSQADIIQRSSAPEAPMRIIDHPTPPTKPEKSKASLLAAFAGVGMGSMATFILFMLSYFDRSLSSSFQFNKLVGLPLMGSLRKLNARKTINFDYLFQTENSSKQEEHFKETLRKIRTEIESSNAKSFLFTSLKDQEGKSFIIAGLAYSFAMKQKKVLIIDTNFKNNTLTGMSVQPFEKYNSITDNGAQLNPNATRLSIDINLANATVVGNKGGQNSPSELLAGVDFKKKIRDLGKQYDYIFLEAACLSKYSDARELVDYVDKIIPIFDASTSLNQGEEEALAFYKSQGDKIMGSILNKVETKNI